MARKAIPDTTYQLNADQSLTLVRDYGTGAEGQALQSQWDVSAQQLERHMPMFSADLSPGDRSAALDIINEQQKRERRG